MFRLALLPLLLMVATDAAEAELQWRSEGNVRSAEIRPEGSGRTGFTRMESAQTAVTFTNRLVGDAFLTNAVAHNGSGVALGDIDGDGRVDLYFCGLQERNRLYRNLGNWRFAEVDPGAAACAEQLSTGATLADVDGDRDLDLLVNGIASGTRLFLNDGSGRFAETQNAGLSRTASATSLALADIDGDGDLDLYCTHYIDEMHLADPTVRFELKRNGNDMMITAVNGQSTATPRLANRFQIFGNGRVRELPEVHGLYRNDGKGHFSPIQFDRGTFLDSSGKPIPPYRDWGLAVMFRDLNHDGAPDLYVANDNSSPDRMWLNTGTGTFREFDRLAFRHTSRSSMGLDVADVDRDGHDDIFVVDMLARDHARRMADLVKDSSDPQLRERVEEQPRYNRNALFFGRTDRTFAEGALLAGLAASDWSWCPMFLDIDLDGFEDLIVTTGFSFDVMDQDSHDRIRKGRLSPYQLKRSRQVHPSWPAPKAVFRNVHEGRFESMGSQWGLSESDVSNGAGLADLDNDGDLDLVVNNLNSRCGLYRNDTASPRIAVRLKGAAPNTQGIGARIQLSGGAIAQSQEMISGGRYLSGGEAQRVFAATVSTGLSLTINWRNARRTVVSNVSPNHIYEVAETNSVVAVNKTNAPAISPLFRDVSSLLSDSHPESAYDDWARQPLLPHRLSRLGPAVAWFDLDADGWDDLIVGAGKGGKVRMFRNDGGRSFTSLGTAFSAADDTSGILVLRDSRSASIFVGGSNLERAPGSMSEVTILNAANSSVLQKLETGPSSVGPLAPADIDGDGTLELFVGGRFIPGRYPEAAASMIFKRNGDRWEPLSKTSAPFAQVGLVSGATFTDLDGDGGSDLALALEWGGIRIFHNERGSFIDVTEQAGLEAWSGLWTSIATGDFDGDGRLDLVVGNWGLNTAYALYHPGKLRIYYGDWNETGVLGLLEAYQHGTNFLPVRDRLKLATVLPDLATRFPTHAAFGSAAVQDILGDRFASARFVEATRLESTVFLNRNGRFDAIPLPREAQMSPVSSISVGDLDGDGIEDLFLSQNFFGALTDLTRDDSGQGLFLRGKGDGHFLPVAAEESGIEIYGEQRAAALADFNQDGRVDLIVTQNGGPTRLLQNERANPGLRIKLQGLPENPAGIGAQLCVRYRNGERGPVRLVAAGSGGWSQDAATQVLGVREVPVEVVVRWPEGLEQKWEVSTKEPVVVGHPAP